MEFPGWTNPSDSEYLILKSDQMPPPRSALLLTEIIDTFGRASARAQGLRAVITTAAKFSTEPNGKLYFRMQGNKVIGMLKVGYRSLFISNEVGKMAQINPLCVLDFYVVEMCQRGGYGKALYEKMLETEGVSPAQLAIDKPSTKLLSFMRKHYGLNRFIPQNNNFVVFS